MENITTNAENPAPPARRPVSLRWTLALTAAAALGATVTYLATRRSAPSAELAASVTPVSPDAGRAAAPAPPPPIRISPERQQLIGVRSATVAPRELTFAIRTVGVISYDERRLAEIHTEVAGWVEKVYVDYVGKPVKRGDPLVTIYSPDLLNAQTDYLIGLRQERAISADDASLTEAARRRLRLWDITDAQLEELERTREPARTLTLSSPFDGVIVERSPFRGQYLTPEMSTVKIADLSKIWVIAELFENEVAQIRVGQAAKVLFPYGGGGPALEGKVDFIYPTLDPRARRVKVRLAFDNPGPVSKPESYVTVVLDTTLGRKLAVPKEAVIDTGERQYVLLALPDGYFQPRDVQVGAAAADAYEVLGGLQEGDRVVTSAQFLVDSETNLEAAMKSMSMGIPGMDMGGAAMKSTSMGIPGMDMGGGQTMPMGPDAGAAMPGLPGMPGMKQ